MNSKYNKIMLTINIYMKKLIYKNNVNILFLFIILFTSINVESSSRVEVSTQTSSNIEEEMDDINSLRWIYKLEEENKKKIIENLSSIHYHAIQEDAVGIIESFLCFSSKSYFPYHTELELDFLFDIPDEDEIKKQAFNTFHQIIDLAKTGNTNKIASLLEIVLSEEETLRNKEEYSKQENIKFPSEKKEILRNFFKRRRQGFCDIGFSLENNNFIEAYDYFMRETTVWMKTYITSGFFSLEQSISDLEDFGEGRKLFFHWNHELEKLLRTLNPENKPRILELLSYKNF